MRPTNREWKFRVLLVASLAVLAGLVAPPALAERHNLRVEVGEAFEIDGEVFEAGVMTVHTVGRFSPTATFAEVRVDGHCVGVLVAHATGGEGESPDPSVFFSRNAAGRLVLTGVAFRGEPVMALHRVGTMPGHDGPAASTAALVAAR